MGFSNEYLTDEEKKLIANTGHYALTRRKNSVYECLCETCTVDRRRNIWMLKNENDYDYDLKANGYMFVLFWGCIQKQNCIELYLKDVGRERGINAKERFGVNIVQYWSIKDIKIPEFSKINKNEVYDVLEDLMTGYGICGDPRHKGPDFDGKIKAIIKGE